jgi:DNA-binding phage protein|tara:strand:- start:657 stop:860 length:204 start_codon:yes stop_codon:yes gene_type:complete
MFNLRIAVKTALTKRSRTMTSVADAIGKDRASLTSSLYNGNTVMKTVKSVAYELDFKLSEFIALGED